MSKLDEVLERVRGVVPASDPLVQMNAKIPQSVAVVLGDVAVGLGVTRSEFTRMMLEVGLEAFRERVGFDEWHRLAGRRMTAEDEEDQRIQEDLERLAELRDLAAAEFMGADEVSELRELESVYGGA